MSASNFMNMEWFDSLLQALATKDHDYIRTELDDNVWMYTISNRVSVWHLCEPECGGVRMILRDNTDGPLYWCRNCGYITTPGVSMAIRLNEVPL